MAKVLTSEKRVLNTPFSTKELNTNERLVATDSPFGILYTNEISDSNIQITDDNEILDLIPINLVFIEEITIDIDINSIQPSFEEEF